MTETKSSKEWLQLKAEDRLLGDGGRDHRGAEDPTPRALLAKIRARMKRRTLQTSQFFHIVIRIEVVKFQKWNWLMV